MTVMGVIVNHGLPPAAARRRGRRRSTACREALRGALAAAIRPAFLAATLVALAVWVIAVLWVKEVPLRRSVDDVAPRADVAHAGSRPRPARPR